MHSNIDFKCLTLIKFKYERSNFEFLMRDAQLYLSGKETFDTFYSLNTASSFAIVLLFILCNSKL
jgi:hypothetical protein